MSTTIRPTRKRAILAFLGAPLAGVLACEFLMLLLGIPDGIRGASLLDILFIFLVYTPWIAVPVYVLAWAVGIPVYAILFRLRQLRLRYFVLVYAAAGVLVAAGVMLRHRGDRPWIMIGLVTGAATGAIFHRIAMGPGAATSRD